MVLAPLQSLPQPAGDTPIGNARLRPPQDDGEEGFRTVMFPITLKHLRVIKTWHVCTSLLTSWRRCSALALVQHITRCTQNAWTHSMCM